MVTWRWYVKSMCSRISTLPNFPVCGYGFIQRNSVITYPREMKKVRTNQSTFYPKRDFPHWQDRFHVFTRTIYHGRCFSVLNVVHYLLFVRWNRLSGHRELEMCWKIEIETERQWMTCLWLEKKRTKERAKECSWRENWYVISDFVPHSVRLIRKKNVLFFWLAMSVIDGENIITECTYKPSFTVWDFWQPKHACSASICIVLQSVLVRT